LDEEEPGETDEGDEHSDPVSESFRGPSGDLKTQNVSDLGRDTEGGLPFGRDFVNSLDRVQLSKSL
jgi:hypothetical protein